MSSEQKPGTPKITDFFNPKIMDQSQSQKRSSSTLSHPEKAQDTKKQNVQTEGISASKIPSKHEFKDLLEPLLLQFKPLRESVDNKVGLEAVIEKQCEEVSIELHKIKNTISNHKLEVTKECTKRIEKKTV